MLKRDGWEMTPAGEESLANTWVRLKEKGPGQAFALGFIVLYLAEPFSEFGICNGGKLLLMN